MLLSRRTMRTKRGASLALVAACAAGLMLLIFGCFQIAMLFSGGQDVRNTIDAGALNVSKRVFELKNSPPPDFADCADTTGAVGLANINRVWGKAALETANEVSMETENLSTNVSKQNVTTAFQDAQTLNDNLYGTLLDGRNLAGFFDDLASNRPVSNTLGNQSTMFSTQNDTWETARVDRGAESNISFVPTQFPADANVSPTSTTIADSVLLNGYAPFTVGSKVFYFVPFRAKETPHLIAESYFTQNRTDKVAIGDVSNALPNAFASHGTTNDSVNMAAAAYAVANPQRTYALAIPHAFVTVRIVNLAEWFVNGKKINETTYGTAPETQWGAKQIALKCGGKLNGYAALGNEFKGQLSLLQAIKYLQGDATPALQKLVQRVQEFQPNFNEAQLETILSSQMVLPEKPIYIIYPQYTNQDASWPGLNVKIAPQGSQQSAWLVAGNRPDGSSTSAVQQTGNKDFPNIDWEQVTGGSCRAGDHWTEMLGQLNWQPGTGFAQSLGELTVNHVTQCYFTAE
jgi:hypothetical protein